MRSGTSDARTFNENSPAQWAATYKCVDTLVTTNDFSRQPCRSGMRGQVRQNEKLCVTVFAECPINCAIYADCIPSVRSRREREACAVLGRRIARHILYKLEKFRQGRRGKRSLSKQPPYLLSTAVHGEHLLIILGYF